MCFIKFSKILYLYKVKRAVARLSISLSQACPPAAQVTISIFNTCSPCFMPGRVNVLASVWPIWRWPWRWCIFSEILILSLLAVLRPPRTRLRWLLPLRVHIYLLSNQWRTFEKKKYFFVVILVQRCFYNKLQLIGGLKMKFTPRKSTPQSDREAYIDSVSLLTRGGGRAERG